MHIPGMSRTYIAAYQHTYTTLTLDVIYQAYDQAKRERIKTECLFVTQRGRQELNNLALHYRDDLDATSDVITFLGMSVEVLPTLPENTLLIGSSGLAAKLAEKS